VSVTSLLNELSDIGTDPRGGYNRLAWTDADTSCREWFVSQSKVRGLDVETDRNGNLWAWLNPSAPGDALVIGSHLDSVPRGGAFDGPLGIASAFAALDALTDFAPSRPVAIVAFADEEGARFGLACAGSRLLTGAIEPDVFRALTDSDGVTTAEAIRRAGPAPEHLGRDDERLKRIGHFIELHVEQGHMPTSAGVDGLTAGSPLGLVTEIWPHGRWRVDLVGRQNHAGTTRLVDRDDPMLGLGRLIIDVRDVAEAAGILATVGKVQVIPGAVNAIPSAATAWIDARGSDESRVRAAIARIGGNSTLESWTPATPFDDRFTSELASTVGGELPLLPSGAGHDAGILSLAGIPTAMIIVRNPSGISHAPEEFAEDADCELGVAALATAIRHLTA